MKYWKTKELTYGKDPTMGSMDVEFTRIIMTPPILIMFSDFNIHNSMMENK